jgi:hypothetical protein
LWWTLLRWVKRLLTLLPTVILTLTLALTLTHTVILTRAPTVTHHHCGRRTHRRLLLPPLELFSLPASAKPHSQSRHLR